MKFDIRSQANQLQIEIETRLLIMQVYIYNICSMVSMLTPKTT